MAQEDEMVRRIRYIVDWLTPRHNLVTYHPQEWSTLDLHPVDRALGWSMLAIDEDAQEVHLRVCPGLLATVTAELPWSPEPASEDLVLDEDAIDNPEDAVVTVPVDDETNSDGRCRLCNQVHAATAPQLRFEACDDPAPDGYWFFDNLVRLVSFMAESEWMAFVDHTTFAVETSPAGRRDAAWERLWHLHPAVHRFMWAAMTRGLDLAYAQEG